MQLWHIAQALVLLALANGTALMVKKCLGRRFAGPLDGGLIMPDGRPLFGSSKTVRGVVAAIVLTAVLAPLVGSRVLVGALIAAFAMAGDLISSFTKRRGRSASTRSPSRSCRCWSALRCCS
jgi:CDP-diglyceride synthetase